MALLYETESYQILGACFEVYKEGVVDSSKPFIRNVWRSNSSFKGLALSRKPN